MDGRLRGGRMRDEMRSGVREYEMRIEGLGDWREDGVDG